MNSIITEQDVELVAKTLTKNEKDFLQMCLNYDNIESQLSDNYSNAGMLEAASLFNNNKHAGAGLLSSLSQKKLGWGDDGSSWGMPANEYNHVFWLSELGVRVAFKTKETPLTNNTIDYQCIVYTLDGPMAKIDGQWYAVIEEQCKVTSVLHLLTDLERERYDLLNAGEQAKVYSTI